MDEIRMFTALRPAPPGSADQIRQRARARLDAALTEVPASPRPAYRVWRRHRLVLLGSGLAAAAAGAAIAVPAALPAGPQGSFVTSAWAVERNAHGTVTVTITKIFHDQARLQHALREDGVRAYVRSLRRCAWEPRGGIREIRRHSKAITLRRTPKATTIVIRPAAIPDSGAVFLGGHIWPDGGRTSRSADSPKGTTVAVAIQYYAMDNNKPPVCSPLRPPIRVGR